MHGRAAKQAATRTADVPARAPAASRAQVAGEPASLGNHGRLALARAGVQAKLAIGAIDDPLEREADRVADAVTRGGPLPDAATAAPSVQRKSDDDPKKKKPEETKPVQRRGEPGAGDAVATPSFESYVAGSRGGGAPLAAPDRSFFESRLGRDLSDVRVHTDAGAASAAREIGAQAFTRGRDIYFGEGHYRPASSDGRWLLAHELAHTIQQSPSAGLGRVQRAKEKGAKSAAANTPANPASAEAAADLSTLTIPKLGLLKIDEAKKEIHWAQIEVPAFKLADHRGQLYAAAKLRRQKAYKRGEPNQRDKWRENIGKNVATAKTKLDEKIAKAYDKNKAPEQHVFLAPAPPKRGKDRLLVGSTTDVAQEAVLPSWDRRGKGQSYDVDHIVELQLANWSSNRSGNDLENMELLESGINSKSGNYIKGKIETKAKSLLDATKKTFPGRFGTSDRDVLERFDFVFEKAVAGKDFADKLTKNDYWTRQEIETDAEHLTKGIEATDFEKIGKRGTVIVCPGKQGGIIKRFVWKGKPGKPDSSDKNWLAPWDLVHVEFDTKSADGEKLGELHVQLDPKGKAWKTDDPGVQIFPVNRFSGALFAGWIDKKLVRAQLSKLKAKHLSPIRVDEMEVGPNGVYAIGVILPELPIIGGTTIDFMLDGDDVEFSKTFLLGELKVPRPLQISGSSVSVFYSTKRGFGVRGAIDFGVERVGTGNVRADVATEGGFSLDGSFVFDKRLFDEAEVKFAYDKGKWSAKGHLGIKEKKIPGIKKADVDVSYENEKLTAEGVADLTIPGLKQGTLKLEYSEKEGLLVGGGFDLKDDIPGIRGGHLDASVLFRSDTGGYEVVAHGKAYPKVPGLDGSQLTVSYERGILDMNVVAPFKRGMLEGSITVGATNREFDKDGKPLDKAADKLHAYGGGVVSVQLTKWLRGSAGIQLLPNGEIELNTKIMLPTRMPLTKPLLEKRKRIGPHIRFDIPILGFSVAGRHVGVYAFIDGALEAFVNIGALELVNAQLEAKYNPDHEDQTEIHGQAGLHLPARAGLTLTVKAGVGAGIVVVDVEVDAAISATLAIEAALDSFARIDWTPATGLEISNVITAYAEPVFEFEVNGEVSVDLDLWLTSKNLYYHKWKGPAGRYGSGLKFGATLPVSYKEGQDFDIGLDKIKFIEPDIDAKKTLSDLWDRIT